MSASGDVRRALVDGWLQLAELDFSLAEELLEGGSRHPLAIAAGPMKSRGAGKAPFDESST